jgi:hypothetical protein
MIILAFTLSYILFFIFYLAIFRQRLSFAIFVLGYAVFAQILLTLCKIGYFSPKVPTIIICFIFAIIQFCSNRKTRRVVKKSFIVLIPFFMLIVWAIMHDSIAQTVSLSSIIGLIAGQGMSLLFLFSFICLVSKKEHVIFLVVLTSSIIVFDFGISVLQFVKFQPAWDLYHALRPVELMADPDMNPNDILTYIEQGGVPGIANASFTHGYILVTFGMFALSYLLLNKKSYLTRLVAGLVCATIPVTMYMAMSRSGFMIFFLIAILMLLIIPFLYKNTKLSVVPISIVIVSIFIVCVLYFVTNTSAWQERNFDKMDTYYDYGRVNIAMNAVREIYSSPLIGKGPEYFLSKYGVVAHNSILNAGIYYGFMGIVILMCHYGTIAYLHFKLPKAPVTNKMSWIVQGALWGYLGYCANGMFHNESFITGGIMASIIIGIWIPARILEFDEFEKMETIRRNIAERHENSEGSLRLGQSIHE